MDFSINNFDKALNDMIEEYIKDHKISKLAHEEITAMIYLYKVYFLFLYLSKAVHPWPFILLPKFGGMSMLTFLF